MKKNFILFLLVAFFSAALFTGCDIFNVDVKVTVKTGNIAVINGTGFYLESVKYRKVGDTSYSENKILTSVLKLSPNEELLITLLDPGTYEVQASAYGEDTVKFSLGSIVVEKDNKTTAARLKIDHIDLTKTTKGIIQFENMTTDTITYLYKRTVGGNFGSDMLGFVTTLKSNDYFYAFVEPGTYDFKANTRTSSSESGIDYYSFKSSFPTGIVIEKSAIKKWSISASDKL